MNSGPPLSILVGPDDLLDVVFGEEVLPFALHKLLSGVDEEHVVELLALLQDKDADGDPGRIEQVRREPDDRVNKSIWPSFKSSVRMRSAAPPRKRTPWGKVMAVTPSSFK